MSEIDLEAVLTELSDASGRQPTEIQAEIEALMDKHGYHLAGAIMVWKSDNKFNLIANKMNYTARVICKEPARKASTKGGESTVSNTHFARLDSETGQIVFENAAMWGADRVKEMNEKFDVDKVYKFEAGRNAKGNLSMISGWRERDAEGKIVETHEIEEVDDEEVPTVFEILPMPISSLIDKVNQYELIRGWVGALKYTGGKEHINNLVGFEVGDMNSLGPCTVWFGGQYTKMTTPEIQAVRQKVAKTAEVVVFGYVRVQGTDVSMNASRIEFVE